VGNDTAIANNMGAEDYLLAVADRRSRLLPLFRQRASLSDEEVDRDRPDVIEPSCATSDWAGCRDRRADALAAAAARGGGGGWGWVWISSSSRRSIVANHRDRALAPPAHVRAEAGPAGPPQPSIDELRRQAGSALVQADDAVKTSEDELGFAVASYGEEATADFRTALDGAKAKVAEAFSLQQQLDDADPDTDDERRAWYSGIIRLAGEADAILDEQAEKFDELRALERNAPAELQRVQAEADAAAARVSAAPQRLAALVGTYAASALAPISDNPAQADARLAFARQELDEATAAVAAGRANDAAVGIRAPRNRSTRPCCSRTRWNGSRPISRPPTRRWPPASPTSSTTCRPVAASATRTRRPSPSESPPTPPPSARR
jgi:hypothetical protein